LTFIYKYQLLKVAYSKRGASATFFMSAISIPHLSESFFAIAVPQIFKEMSLRNIALPQFRNRSSFSSPQLQFTAL
jgi:hypothetical protein